MFNFSLVLLCFRVTIIVNKAVLRQIIWFIKHKKSHKQSSCTVFVRNDWVLCNSYDTEVFKFLIYHASFALLLDTVNSLVGLLNVFSVFFYLRLLLCFTFPVFMTSKPE